jgi:hypothetical protein
VGVRGEGLVGSGCQKWVSEEVGSMRAAFRVEAGRKWAAVQ